MGIALSDTMTFFRFKKYIFITPKPKKLKKRNIILFLSLFLLASGIFAQDKFTLVKEGEYAPDFEIETLEGKKLQFSKLKGKVFVDKLTPELKDQIPKTLENYPVVIEETGEFKSL